MFPGETPDNPIEPSWHGSAGCGTCAFEIDGEHELANEPAQVSGAFLTAPVTGGATATFFGLPTVGSATASQGALVAGYEVASDALPITSFVVLVPEPSPLTLGCAALLALHGRQRRAPMASR